MAPSMPLTAVEAHREVEVNVGVHYCWCACVVVGLSCYLRMVSMFRASVFLMASSVANPSSTPSKAMS